MESPELFRKYLSGLRDHWVEQDPSTKRLLDVFLTS